MAFYPFYKELQDTSLNMPEGNFGLWYNKFIPLSDAYKPADENGKDTMPVEHYFKRYGQMKKIAAAMLHQLLKQKHADMNDFCTSFPPDKYEEIVIYATLTTPLITGIGESHPHEVSMVFDHNMGIPYIPASGIKGIVRFAHTLSLIPEACERGAINEKGYFNDEDNWTMIPMMFGTQKNRGRVVFLDTYPEKVPDLYVDIMNPHYAPYYSEGKPPADHHNPTPIKFLTVAKETTFIFRAVAEKENEMPEKVRTAFIKALTEEGIGAKTAVGYGRFKIKETGAKKNNTSNMQPEQFSFAASHEEVWDKAYVSFNAGGGGIVTATSKDGKKAELRGKDKALAASAELLHKKLFEGKRQIDKVRVTVRKTGNSYGIISIAPQNP